MVSRSNEGFSIDFIEIDLDDKLSKEYSCF